MPITSNGPWSEVGEVELVDEAHSTVHHQRLGRRAGDDIHRITGVGLAEAQGREEENKNADADRPQKLDHPATWLGSVKVNYSSHVRGC
jgi:hypothetical protein